MDTLTIGIIWFIAAFCTTIAFLPQTLKIIRTKDTKALSLAMYILFTFWVAMWLIYWIIINSLPIIIANSITFILSSIILCYKIKNRYFRN
jgi:MtN3 and saliva related transmembrane protein